MKITFRRSFEKQEAKRVADLEWLRGLKEVEDRMVTEVRGVKTIIAKRKTDVGLVYIYARIRN